MRGRLHDVALVAAQMGLLAASGAAGFRGPRWPRTGRRLRRCAGAAMLVGGAVLGGAGARALGPALTPLPTPREGAGLRDAGPYRFVRHPIYGGLLFGAVGAALLRRPAALVPLAGLAAVLHAKVLREEAMLEAAHPGYADYRRRVPYRLLPPIA